MVSILPAERSPWDVIGKQINQNVSNVLPGAVQQGYNRGQLQESLQHVKNMSKNPNSTPLDMSLDTLIALSGIPGSERYISTILPQLMKSAEANKSQQTRLPGENREQFQPAQRQQLPEFMQGKQARNPQQQTEQFFPSNVGPQEQTGNVPQEATTGVKQKLLDRHQKIQEARQLAEERNAAGIPTTLPEAMREVNAAEEDKKLYNTEVDAELAQRKQGQKDYGKKAVDKLEEYYPTANTEIKTLFKKKGEDISKTGKSEAEIERYLTKEAERFKNIIANVEKDISAPRSYKTLGRHLNGNYKNFEEASSDLRKHIQPLIDEGLWDFSRHLLAKKGYGPEEIDMTINPLSERSKSEINKVETLFKVPFGKRKFGLSDEEADKAIIKDTLKNIKEYEPNFSLLLARKMFEDKKYSWREFKDALNELESEGFKLEDDQKNQRGMLDSPPLSGLDVLLEGLNFIGR
jgi:hypothetical protein